MERPAVLLRLRADPRELRERWAGVEESADRESRRLAAAAWLYHLGITLFSHRERRALDAAAARPLAALAARDLALAGVAFRGDSTARRVALGVTVASDLLAMRALARRSPLALVAEDRSMSQFGLAWGLVGLLDPWPGAEAVAYVAPAAAHATVARLWRLPPGSSRRYVAREFAWSVAVVGVARDLRNRVGAASVERARQAARAARLVDRLSLIRAGASFYQKYVHSLRDPVITSAQWVAGRTAWSADSGGDVLLRLCHAESRRLERFAVGEEESLRPLLERLVLHRQVRGLATTIEPSTETIADETFRHATNARLDELVDSDLSSYKHHIAVWVTEVGESRSLCIGSPDVQSDSSRGWRIELR